MSKCFAIVPKTPVNCLHGTNLTGGRLHKWCRNGLRDDCVSGDEMDWDQNLSVAEMDAVPKVSVLGDATGDTYDTMIIFSCQRGGSVECM